jgi:AcrR family transcriptional regulator
MEASVEIPRRLEGDKARRIIQAMRSSVGRRGAAGSTFDHVAREAGVSRGLLHYYFGSKERLLVEVVRHDCELRIAAIDEGLRGAVSVDAVVASLVTQFEAFVEDEPGLAVLYEMLSASRHSGEIRAELAELYRRWRAHLAGALLEKERQGVVRLEADAESVAAVLFALGDGMGLQLISDPNRDGSDALALGASVARRLLGGE